MDAQSRTRFLYDAIAVTTLCVAGVCFYQYELCKQLFHPDLYVDFPSYFYGYRAYAAGHSPYDPANIAAAAQIDGNEKIVDKFLYPPLALLLVGPVVGNLSLHQAYAVWLSLSHVVLLVTIGLWLSLRRASLRSIQALAICLFPLVFYPVRLTLEPGQMNLVLYLTVVLALYAHARGWPPWAVAGFLALGASIKIIPGIFFAVFLLRRDWRTVLYGIAWGIALAVFQWLYFGWEYLAGFRDMMRLISGTRYSIVNNVSLRGALWRLVDGGYLPNDTWAIAIFALLAAVLLAGCVFAIATRRQGNLVLHCGLFLVTWFLVNTPSWAHHLTLLLPIYCGTADLILSARCPRGVQAAVLASYVLIAPYWGQFQLQFATWTAPLQSMSTLGLLLLYGSLLYLLLKGGPEVEEKVFTVPVEGCWDSGRTG